MARYKNIAFEESKKGLYKWLWWFVSFLFSALLLLKSVTGMFELVEIRSGQLNLSSYILASTFLIALLITWHHLLAPGSIKAALWSFALSLLVVACLPYFIMTHWSIGDNFIANALIFGFIQWPFILSPFSALNIGLAYIRKRINPPHLILLLLIALLILPFFYFIPSHNVRNFAQTLYDRHSELLPVITLTDRGGTFHKAALKSYITTEKMKRLSKTELAEHGCVEGLDLDSYVPGYNSYPPSCEFFVGSKLAPEIIKWTAADFTLPSDIEAKLAHIGKAEWEKQCQEVKDVLTDKKKRMCYVVGALYFQDTDFCNELHQEDLDNTYGERDDRQRRLFPSNQSLFSLCVTGVAAKANNPALCTEELTGNDSQACKARLNPQAR